MIPADPADHSNVSIEISAGVGGAEAMLFTRDLFNMYFAYAQYKGWNVEVAMLDETELGDAMHLTLNCLAISMLFLDYDKLK